MKNSLVLATLLASFLLPAMAKDEANVAATYKVAAESFLIDPRKQEWVEVWHVTGVVDMEEDPKYTKVIRNVVPPKNPVKRAEEVERALGRKIFRLGSFTEYFWWKHPNILEDDETTFGYVEERDSEQGEVTERLPLFISAKHLTPNLTKVEFKIFLQNGSVLYVIETFSRTGYHLPVERVLKLVSATGEELSRITYTRTT